MSSLILKTTSAHYGGNWSDDDYVVLCDGQVIGRILLHLMAPPGQRWYWAISAREQAPSIYNRGYSATREQAMTDFKTRWMQGTVKH